MLQLENLAYCHLDRMQSGWNNALVLLISQLIISLFDHNLSMYRYTLTPGLNVNALFVFCLCPLLNRAGIEMLWGVTELLSACDPKQSRGHDISPPPPQTLRHSLSLSLSVACPLGSSWRGDVESINGLPNECKGWALCEGQQCNNGK